MPEQGWGAPTYGNRSDAHIGRMPLLGDVENEASTS